jgi:hypothetical protein
MRQEIIISDGEICTSWICSSCGEVVDQVILKNRPPELQKNKGQDLGPSVSGNTIIIVSTEVNVSIPGHKAAKMGLNIYRKK